MIINRMQWILWQPLDLFILLLLLDHGLLLGLGQLVEPPLDIHEVVWVGRVEIE